MQQRFRTTALGFCAQFGSRHFGWRPMMELLFTTVFLLSSQQRAYNALPPAQSRLRAPASSQWQGKHQGLRTKGGPAHLVIHFWYLIPVSVGMAHAWRILGGRFQPICAVGVPYAWEEQSRLSEIGSTWGSRDGGWTAAWLLL